MEATLTKGMKLLVPIDPFVNLIVVPFKVQNLMCFTPIETNSLSFLHANPVTLYFYFLLCFYPLLKYRGFTCSSSHRLPNYCRRPFQSKSLLCR
jgi:hypothetical protein